MGEESPLGFTGGDWEFESIRGFIHTFDGEQRLAVASLIRCDADGRLMAASKKMFEALGPCMFVLLRLDAMKGKGPSYRSELTKVVVEALVKATGMEIDADEVHDILTEGT